MAHNTTLNTQHLTHNTQRLVKKVVWCVFPLIMPISAKFSALDAGGDAGGGGTRGGHPPRYLSIPNRDLSNFRGFPHSLEPTPLPHKTTVLWTSLAMRMPCSSVN